MATGYIGAVNNSTIIYTPSSTAKLKIAYMTGGSGVISVNGTPICTSVQSAGVVDIFVAAGQAITIASSAASANAVISTLEEST